MKKRVAVGLAVFGLLACPLLVVGQFDARKWAWRAPLEAPPLDGIVALPLNGEIYDILLSPPHDLRVVNADGALVPHAIRCGRTTAATAVDSRPVRIINRTSTPGRFSRAVLDFGERVVKNKLQVRMSGQNYLRKVTIEGGDDQTNWETVAENLLLFNVQTPEQSLRTDMLAFSENNFRYLRLTVENSPDDVDRVEIENVAAFYEEPAGDPQLIRVEVAHQAIDQEQKTTVITLDLRFQNLPLHSVVLDAAERQFQRPYRIEGRNTLTHKVYQRAEEAWRAKDTETPWSFVARGTFQRSEELGRPVESREAVIPHAAYRYLRITIENGDDAPLSFRDITVFRRTCSLIFEAHSGTPYSIYFGNAEAQAPEYDFARSLAGMDIAAIPQVRTKPLERLRPADPPIPWSERYWYVMGAAVVVAVLVMVWMIIPALRAERR